ncbi:ABC transporter substrate-binding protein [Enterococcus hirae]|nr:ABC transporter substrate-binding protein [Enterococcus hirae]
MKKRKWKKIGLVLGAALLALSITGCSSSTSKSSSSAADSSTSSKKAATRKVKDMAGTEVTLPKKVDKVINLWSANNQVQMLLSGTDQLAGTTEINKQLPWATLVFPKLKDIPSYSPKSGGAINAEEILKADPSVVIASDENQIKTVRDAGATAAFVNFRDFKGLKETVTKTGEILGGAAPKKADKFVTYFDKNLSYVQDKLKGVTDKPKVYEIQGTSPLGTDGKTSIATEWIEAAGGENAMSDVTDQNMTNVTMEQVLQAKPDVIILGTQNAAKIKDQIENDPDWQSVPAVANKKIYTNPIGTFLWSRYSCEEALQVLWVAQLLHPDQFKDLDMKKEVQKFYKDFYDFDLTEEQAQKMLDGQNP